jgi:hypothetical protein
MLNFRRKYLKVCIYKFIEELVLDFIIEIVISLVEITNKLKSLMTEQCIICIFF